MSIDCEVNFRCIAQDAAHEEDTPVEDTGMIALTCTLLLLSNSVVASAAGLVEMESLQFIARDDSACSEQDVFPAKMGGKGDGTFISQSVRSRRDVDTNVR